jgi:hypothetical protein
MEVVPDDDDFFVDDPNFVANFEPFPLSKNGDPNPHEKGIIESQFSESPDFFQLGKAVQDTRKREERRRRGKREKKGGLEIGVITSFHHSFQKNSNPDYK